jgi:hypothetical protein
MSDNRALDQSMVQRSIPALGPDGEAIGEKPRKAAAGKALLVYLGTGSIGAALIAYLIFHGMGC